MPGGQGLGHAVALKINKEEKILWGTKGYREPIKPKLKGGKGLQGRNGKRGERAWGGIKKNSWGVEP